MLVDACPATSDPVACAKVNSGILTRGLYASVNDFASMYIELVNGRGLAHGNFSVVQVRSQPMPPLVVSGAPNNKRACHVTHARHCRAH